MNYFSNCPKRKKCICLHFFIIQKINLYWTSLAGRKSSSDLMGNFATVEGSQNFLH